MARFVKQYANLADIVGDAARRYVTEVRGGVFPTAEHTFTSDSALRPPQ